MYILGGPCKEHFESKFAGSSGVFRTHQGLGLDSVVFNELLPSSGHTERELAPASVRSNKELAPTTNWTNIVESRETHLFWIVLLGLCSQG
jgi:hypothetical protein